jgi:glutaredoxin
MTDMENYSNLSADVHYMGKSMSLREYVLDTAIQTIQPDNFKVGSIFGKALFDRLMERKEMEYESDARSNVSFSETDYQSLNPNVARQLVQRSFIQTKILAEYLDEYEIDVDVDDLTAYEKAELERQLYMAYIGGKFKRTSFNDIMKDIEKSQLTLFVDGDGDNLTISEYVDFKLVELGASLSNVIAEAVLSHREYWINNVPGFAYLLYSTDLDKVGSNEFDDIEILNLGVLKKIKGTMNVRPVTVPSEKYVKTIVRVFQELIRAVRSINVFGNDEEPKSLDIDNNNCILILSELFYSCNAIMIPNVDVPKYLEEFVHDWDDFEEVDVRIFWTFFMKLHTFFGSELGTVIKEDWAKGHEVNKKVKAVAESVYNKRSRLDIYSGAQIKRLDFVKGPRVIYTRSGCGHCQRAKAMMNNDTMRDMLRVGKNGATFEERDFDTNPPNGIDLSGYSMLPIVVIGGKFIGGADELEEMIEEIKTTPLIPSSARR